MHTPLDDDDMVVIYLLCTIVPYHYVLCIIRFFCENARFVPVAYFLVIMQSSEYTSE